MQVSSAEDDDPVHYPTLVMGLLLSLLFLVVIIVIVVALLLKYRRKSRKHALAADDGPISNFTNPVFSSSQGEDSSVSYSSAGATASINTVTETKKGIPEDEDCTPAPPPYTPHPEGEITPGPLLPTYEQSARQGAVGFVNLGFGDVTKKSAESARDAAENDYDTLPSRCESVVGDDEGGDGAYNLDNPLYATLHTTTMDASCDSTEESDRDNTMNSSLEGSAL